jgi:hypothetical protein
MLGSAWSGPMDWIKNLDREHIDKQLMYAGLVLVAYELMKSMIVDPIKAFYRNTTFHSSSMPFKSYEQDVRGRHSNEFEACLFYLRDFMEAIGSKDVLAIQGLRKHRNDLAHDLVARLSGLKFDEYLPLWEEVNQTLFKLSNYRAYIEFGSDPDPAFKDVDWANEPGYEYQLFQEVLAKVRLLNVPYLPASG